MDRQHRHPELPDNLRDDSRRPAAVGPWPASPVVGPAHTRLDPGALANVQRQAGNQAAAALVAGRTRRGPTPTVQRDGPGRGRHAGGASAAMSRADFETDATRLGVGQVVNGTLDRQVSRLNSLSPGDLVGDALRADVEAGRQQWMAWDPGASSPVYRAILAGLSDFATAMGGLPPIREIVFYKRDYNGVRVEGRMRTGWAGTAADYQAGALYVYENAALQATAKVIPTRRDASGGASPTDQPTQAQGIGRIITHELGHGLQEVAHDPAAVRQAAGPLMMERYAREIGWRQAATGNRAWSLYDAGDPAVQAALAAGRAPDARYQITAATWQQGWHEQPISDYQVRTGPFEDFPEAVMAFVANRTMLQQRSPRRHDFVQSVITELAGRLQGPGASSGGPGSGTSASGTGGTGSGSERAGGGGEARRP